MEWPPKTVTQVTQRSGSHLPRGGMGDSRPSTRESPAPSTTAPLITAVLPSSASGPLPPPLPVKNGYSVFSAQPLYPYYGPLIPQAHHPRIPLIRHK
ncbi:hypothetical protein FA13DRAFT_53783 [Coprinellus micaceus]|nr:hypothetical protein FA13DRAFT_53783 [Coprinellus micaceus]